ncbi:MAG: hypothetical protein IJ015_01600 [Ruminococcus sp.]|nr:hypothetical protein [Ruminococcus sp.]
MLRLFLRDGTETVPYSFNINSSLPTVGASTTCPFSGRRGCRFLQYIIPCLVDVFEITHLRSLTFVYVRLRSFTFVYVRNQEEDKYEYKYKEEYKEEYKE